MARCFSPTRGSLLLTRFKMFERNDQVSHFLCLRIHPEGVSILLIQLFRILDYLIAGPAIPHLCVVFLICDLTAETI